MVDKLKANEDLVSKTPQPEENYYFTEDRIPIVNPSHLSDTSSFHQLFLIGKVIGESLPIKLILLSVLLNGNLLGISLSLTWEMVVA